MVDEEDGPAGNGHDGEKRNETAARRTRHETKVLRGVRWEGDTKHQKKSIGVGGQVLWQVLVT